jgi:hypothetical protein
MLVAGLAAAFTLLAGCGGGDDENTTTPTSGGGAQAVTAGVFVAEVEGTDADIALVTDGKRLTGAYLCIPKGGTSWLSPAPLVAGKAKLVARRGVSLGEASFTGDSATGHVTVAGGSRNFSAKLATGKAGLYRTTSGTAGEPGSTETGWIVLPDGSVCGVTNSITPGGGFKSKPAPSKPKGQVTNFANPYSD